MVPVHGASTRNHLGVVFLQNYVMSILNNNTLLKIGKTLSTVSLTIFNKKPGYLHEGSPAIC